MLHKKKETMLPGSEVGHFSLLYYLLYLFKQLITSKEVKIHTKLSYLLTLKQVVRRRGVRSRYNIYIYNRQSLQVTVTVHSVSISDYSRFFNF